jgi:hypothetical protein
MENLYRVGVELALANGVSPVISIITRDLLHMQRHIDAAAVGFNKLGAALAGVGGMFVGGVMLEGMEEVVKHGNDLVRLQRNMYQAGASMTDVQNAYAKAWEMTGKYANMSATEVLQMMNDARMTFGTQDVAIQHIDPFVKMGAFLKAYDGGAHGSGDELLSELNAAMKSGELSGKIDPKTMEENAKQLTAMKVAYGQQVNILAYLQAQRTAGVALRNTDDAFRYGIFPALVQEQGASAGTMSMTAFQKLVAGTRNSTAALREMVELGLIEGGDKRIDYDKIGRAIRINDPTAIKSGDDFAKNPAEWVWTVLKPLLEQKAHNNPIREAQIISRMFPDRNAAKFITELVQQEAKLKKDAQAMMNVRKDFESYLDGSLDYQMEGFSTQWKNLMDALGAPVVKQATAMLGALNQELSGVSKWMAFHPENAGMIVKAITVVGAALFGLGAAALVGVAFAFAGIPGLVVGGLVALGAAIVLFWGKIKLAKLYWDTLWSSGVFNTMISDFAKKLGSGILAVPGMVASAITQMASALGSALSSAIAGAVGRFGRFLGFGGGGVEKQSFAPPGNQGGGARTFRTALNIDGRVLGEAVAYYIAKGSQHMGSSADFDGMQAAMPVDYSPA